MVSPNRREDNAKPSALLVTAGCEGRLSKFEERSASEPILACIRGEVAKSADAQIPNTFTCYNGRIHKQGSLLNEGSLYPCPLRTKQKQVARQESVNRVKVADEPVVIIKSIPKKRW